MKRHYCDYANKICYVCIEIRVVIGLFIQIKHVQRVKAAAKNYVRDLLMEEKYIVEIKNNNI